MFGEVIDVRMSAGGKGNQEAIVAFTEADDAEAICTAYNGENLCGKKVSVKLREPVPKSAADTSMRESEPDSRSESGSSSSDSGSDSDSDSDSNRGPTSKRCKPGDSSD